MNKTVIKEMQKLMALCIEINSKTEHDVFFRYDGHVNWFCVSLYENGWSDKKDLINLTIEGSGDKPTLPNINKCRQKLLKYKEW